MALVCVSCKHTSRRAPCLVEAAPNGILEPPPNASHLTSAWLLMTPADQNERAIPRISYERSCSRGPRVKCVKSGCMSAPKNDHVRRPGQSSKRDAHLRRVPGSSCTLDHCELYSSCDDIELTIPEARGVEHKGRRPRGWFVVGRVPAGKTLASSRILHL